MSEKRLQLISIVITNYNYGQYLREAIESALSQTYQNIEIILIDDASTDDSRKIYNKYHDKIRIIEHKKNKGIVFSRNEALNIIKGDFLCFLDADDILPNDYIEKLMTEMVDERQDVVYTDLQTFGDGNDLMVLPDFSLDKIIGRNIVDMSALIRVEAIGDQRFDKNLDKLSHEDWDFFLGLALKGKKFARLPSAALNYRIHNDIKSRNAISDINQSTLRLLKVNDYIINKYKKLYPKTVDFTMNNEIVELAEQAEIDKKSLISEQKSLVADRDELQKQLVTIRQKCVKQHDNLTDAIAQLKNLRNSRSYKLGKVIASPSIVAKHAKRYGAKSAAILVGKKVLRTQKSRALVKRIFHMDRVTKYEKYIRENYPNGEKIAQICAENFVYNPLISVIVPTYNTPENFLRETIECVQNQTYANWELVIVDDASPDEKVRKIIREYVVKEPRIKHTFLKTNHHIAGATNEGIKIAKGEFISLFDHDDLLWPNALTEIVRTLNINRKLDFIYTDEDKVDESGKTHFDPVFKPDWNPDFLRSVNYITHFTTIRKKVLDQYGYENGKYNGAQDWELFLRITRNIPRENIYHIAKILYDWRVSATSTAGGTGAKPYVTEAQRNALLDDMRSRGYDGTIDVLDNWSWMIKYPVKGTPLISIVIPTKNQLEVVKRCVDSIFEKTSYKNFEVILVDTGSDEHETYDYYEEISRKHKNFTQYDFREKRFSYSRTCNFGASKARGELLVQLNNDTEVITPEWLELMAGYAQRPEIGAVGVKLYYPGNHVVQHAGIRIGFRGHKIGGKEIIASNLMWRFDENSPKVLMNYFGLECVRDQSAVTAACMMVRTKLFREIGGFDENFAVTYNDVDLCLKICEKGYDNVLLPRVKLTHHESISVGDPREKKRDSSEFAAAEELFKKRWSRYIQHDPNYNENLSNSRSDFML